jgi:anti-sigma B factor antagonist
VPDEKAVELIVADDAAPPTVVLRGEIDMLFEVQLQTCFQNALETHPSEIVVDMAQLTFIDSTGLNALMAAKRMLQENGGHLVIANPPRIALRVLEMSGLTEVFTIR